MSDTHDEPTPARFLLRPRGIALVCAAVLVLLVVLYAMFLRTDYVVLYDELKPADAAAIVAKLQADGIPHKVGDGGTQVLVPAQDVDAAKIDIAGSDIPMKGSVGFELFNKSDMGLTDFAQKINYQRALQGELARTIMMMAGIEAARVHLALPERTLFRATQSSPKAAVEVTAKPGAVVDPGQVAGIQQLVAAAVPDLPAGSVVVLDADGRVIGASGAAPDNGAPEDDEVTAARHYFEARARHALDMALPGVVFAAHALVTALPPRTPAVTVDGNASDAAAARDFQLRLTIISPTPLNDEDEKLARDAVEAAVGVDASRGDSVQFEVGTLPTVAATPVLANGAVPPSGTRVNRVPSPPPLGLDWSRWWPLGALFVIFAVAVLLRPRPSVVAPGSSDPEAFAARLRQQLATEAGDG